MSSQIQNQPKRLSAGIIILGIVAIVLLMVISYLLFKIAVLAAQTMPALR